MNFVTKIADQPVQRFVYAGNVYMIKGDDLYKEIYFNGGNQLNGFGKFFKKIGKLVKKVVKSPVLGIALTAASGGAFGVLSASQLMAVNVAKGVTGFSGLLASRKQLSTQAAADTGNAAFYDAQIKLVDDQIKAAGGLPATATAATLATSLATNAEGTKAVQAYAAYLNAGGDPSSFSLTGSSAKLPNVTSFGGLTPQMMIAGGVGLIGVILIATNIGKR